jgi:hypothetical protein
LAFNHPVLGESLSLEIHFLDFHEDLYDQKYPALLKYLRPEQCIESLEVSSKSHKTGRSSSVTKALGTDFYLLYLNIFRKFDSEPPEQK